MIDRIITCSEDKTPLNEDKERDKLLKTVFLDKKISTPIDGIYVPCINCNSHVHFDEIGKNY